MNTKNNRQYRDSERRMEQAMLDLMNANPAERITVRAVCERAQVNRSTFYAHYESVPAMLEAMEDTLHRELIASYPAHAGTVPFSAASFVLFLSFIREHRSFYRVALRTRRDFPIEQGADELWERIVRPRCLRAGVHTEEEMHCYFVGFQAAFTVVLRRWVERGCVEAEQDIARIMEDLVPTVLTNGGRPAAP